MFIIKILAKCKFYKLTDKSQNMLRYFKKMRKLYRRYFSEVGFFTKRINYGLNYAFNAGLIDYRERCAFEFLNSKMLINGCDLGALEESLSQLKLCGYTKISIKKFPEFQHKVEAARVFLEGLSKAHGFKNFTQVVNDRKGKSKKYWIDLYNKHARPNENVDPVLDMLLSNEILYLVLKYLNQVPVLTELNFYYTPPSKGKSANSGSQNWHLDNERAKQLKIFYSPFQIQLANGPTTLMPLQYSAKLPYPNYPDYFSDEDARLAGFPVSEAVSLCSLPDEIYVADTSRCYHFGSRTDGGARSLMIAGFGTIESYLYPWAVKEQTKSLYGNRFFNELLIKKCCG